MKSEEFTSFEDAEPEKNKWLIVTNNINSKNAHGEMSHAWLTTFWTHSKKDGYIVTFDNSYCEIHRLTHWKYA